MRNPCLPLALLFSVALVAPTASAAGPGNGHKDGHKDGHKNKPDKDHHDGHHGGHHGGGHGGGGNGGGGNGGGGNSGGNGGGQGQVVGTIEGAGQRLSFSFGGKLALKANGKTVGKFALVAHPSSPAGTTLSVTCTYNRFSDTTINGASATFRAIGKCRRLDADGTITQFDVQNQIQIVDNAQGDQIDVNFVGANGIAIPGGALSFGNFTVAGSAT